MADLVIECPPPDGHIEFNTPTTRTEPPTNLRIREFLKKHHVNGVSPNGSNADSGNSSDDQQRQLANQSPPPNCSICLGRVKSKCFTDSCMHQFCFSCLLEWSKVKPECPLCKQTFKSIIHNVTSMDSYEEYKVEVQQRHVNWINLPFQPGAVDMSLLFSASLPTYQRREPQASDSARRRLYQLFRHDSPLVQRFAQTYPNDFYPTRVSGIQWREYIYNRRLFAEPLNDLSGQSRDISSEFYRANPAQLHRLTPWLHRELVCLCGDQQPMQSITFLMQRIESLIQNYDMTSFDFQSRIRVLVPNHTDHFIHELINYARSPYDLIGYDRYVTYLPRFESDTNDIVTLSSSEEGSDVEFVGTIDIETTDDIIQILHPNQNASGNDNQAMSNINGGSSNNSSSNNNISNNNSNNSSNHNNDGNFEQPGASTSGVTTATQTANNQASNFADDSDEEEIKNYLQHKPNVTAEEIIRGRTGPTPPNGEQTSSNSSNNQNHNENTENNANSDFSSERTIIATPVDIGQTHEIVASTSVASVDATPVTLGITPKVEPNTLTKSTQEIIDADTGSDSDECLFVCAKKPPHLRTPEYVELNSDSDSDVVFVSSETCAAPPSLPQLPSLPSLSSMPSMPSLPTLPSHTSTMTRAMDAIHEAEKTVYNLFSAVQCTEPILRRKRSRPTVENVSTTYTSQNTSTYEAKPSTSEDMLQWLIPTTQHSRRISPRSNSKRHSMHTSSERPRLTTTIKISRGKKIYESSSSDTDQSTDPETTSTSSSNSCDSSTVESSHEEYVCSNSRVRTKRPANNDGPSLAPRKKFRKRRVRRDHDTSLSDDSDDDNEMS